MGNSSLIAFVCLFPSARILAEYSKYRSYLKVVAVYVKYVRRLRCFCFEYQLWHSERCKSFRAIEQRAVHCCLSHAQMFKQKRVLWIFCRRTEINEINVMLRCFPKAIKQVYKLKNRSLKLFMTRTNTGFEWNKFLFAYFGSTALDHF